jgi:type II secretory pathway pseudopilin PulG
MEFAMAGAVVAAVMPQSLREAWSFARLVVRGGINSRSAPQKHLPQAFGPGQTTAAAGFALIESVIGVAILTLVLGCVFAMNAHILGLLKQGKESTFATELIQERIEQLRTGNWTQVTDPAYLRNAVGGRTTTATNLPEVTETITVEPRDNPSNLSISYTRNPDNTVSPASATGSDLTTQNSVKVTVDIQWKSRGRTRRRSMVTVLTRDGIIAL